MKSFVAAIKEGANGIESGKYSFSRIFLVDSFGLGNKFG